VQALAFGPDRATLASSAWDYRILFWDTATRRLVRLALIGHEVGVESLPFGADGRRLVSAAQDDTVIVWDVDVGSWEERACRIANRNFTCAEWTRFFTDTPYRPNCRGMSSLHDCSSRSAGGAAFQDLIVVASAQEDNFEGRVVTLFGAPFSGLPASPTNSFIHSRISSRTRRKTAMVVSAAFGVALSVGLLERGATQPNGIQRHRREGSERV
jgi:WD40 repeat protein